MVFITNAMPSSGKGWWDYFCEGARAVVPFAVVYVAWQQWKLSKNQKEIAHSKLKLEVFEKRYELYKKFKDTVHEFILKIYTSSYDDLDKLHDNIYFLSYEFEFLYNSNVHDEARNMSLICYEILKEKRKNLNEGGEVKEFKDKVSKNFSIVLSFLNVSFPKLVKPFLNLEELDRL